MDEVKHIYKFVAADYYVIAGYLLLLVSVGFIVKKLCGNVKDYFIGGNRILLVACRRKLFYDVFQCLDLYRCRGFCVQAWYTDLSAVLF